MLKILVVSPHPDDAEIAVGGFIRQARRAGRNVTIAICTGEGDLKMKHSGLTVPFALRQTEQHAAAGHMGNPEFLWLDLAAASRFDQTPQAEFVSRFDQVFADFDTIMLPLPSYNDDHRRVWQAGMAAFRPGKHNSATVLAYEQPFSNCIGEQITGAFGKRYYVLTAETMAAKERAIHAHNSQMHGREHTIYGPEGAHRHAVSRGQEVGVRFAEMVYVVREIGGI